MFRTAIQPRFGDTDCLGHINNAVLAAWFENARTPIFRIFNPELNTDRKVWPFILAHTEYDFESELFFGGEVEIRTWISRIGTKSFTVYQEAWQDGRRCVTGSAVMVRYDHNTKKSIPLSEDKKKLLGEHLFTG